MADYRTFSELIQQDDADDLLDNVPSELIARFTDELDQGEADRIWIAADEFYIEYYHGPYILINRLVELSTRARTTGWRRFQGALIRFSLQRYLEWCHGRLQSFTADRDRYREGYAIDELDTVLPYLVEFGAPHDTLALTNAILAIPAVHARIRLLDSIASLTVSAGRENPMLMLAREADTHLAAAITEHWERKFRATSSHSASLWEDPIGTGSLVRFPAVIRVLAQHYPAIVMLEIGYSAGIRASTAHDVRRRLSELGIESNQDAFAAMGTLWYLLRQMHELQPRSYDHETELSGLRAEVLELVLAQPALWVRALPWILLHGQSIKRDVIAITCELGRTEKQIAAVLKELRDEPAVSTLAMGILALIGGIARPGEQHTLALADSLAHYFDGTPKFPSPLTVRSATWLGSTRLENYLRDGASRACEYFRKHVVGRVGSQEEALTATFLNELLVQFRDSEKMASHTHSESYGTPKLRLSQREISKQTEEPKYGCDLAFIVKAHAKDVYRMDWASLVQVKKTLAKPASTSTADTWKIDVAQLQTLIDVCPTSVYLLICAHGEILVVPARHLMGYVRGKAKGHTAMSRTLGYNDIRSAAIPFEQYLVDLLVGQ